jgi:LysM repeat protein
MIVRLFFACALACGVVAFSGCTFSNSATLEEEKEPHFLEGKSKLNSMDYAGAIESFEQALEVNPKSAAAHFELGCLCDQREADPAAAIYHYGRYLKLRPRGDKTERARTRITTCQQQLARTVSLGPVTQGMQHESDVLAEQVKKLTEENKALRDALDKWEASGAAAKTASPPVEAASGAGRVAPAPRTSQVRLIVPDSNNGVMGIRESSGIRSQATGRTHTVSSGETPLAIAKRYGIRVETLMAANPRLEPRRMRVGQTLSIPSS